MGVSASASYGPAVGWGLGNRNSSRRGGGGLALGKVPWGGMMPKTVHCSAPPSPTLQNDAFSWPPGGSSPAHVRGDGALGTGGPGTSGPVGPVRREQGPAASCLATEEGAGLSRGRGRGPWRPCLGTRGARQWGCEGGPHGGRAPISCLQRPQSPSPDTRSPMSALACPGSCSHTPAALVSEPEVPFGHL